MVNPVAQVSLLPVGQRPHIELYGTVIVQYEATAGTRVVAEVASMSNFLRRGWTAPNGTGKFVGG